MHQILSATFRSFLSSFAATATICIGNILISLAASVFTLEDQIELVKNKYLISLIQAAFVFIFVNFFIPNESWVEPLTLTQFKTLFVIFSFLIFLFFVTFFEYYYLV